MAGQISLDVARKQGACIPCSQKEPVAFRPTVTRSSEFTKRRVVQVRVDALGLDEFAKGPGWITHPKATRRLMRYWTRGKGAAKIRWFMKGSMRRCIRQLRKYLPENAPGYCANLHKEVTGEWPRGGVIPS